MYCDVDKLCRLCGTLKSNVLIGIYSPEGETKMLERKVRMCLPIVISSTDCMPKQICSTCLDKLETSYELYMLCNSAQTTIKRLLHYQASLRNETSASKTCLIEKFEKEKEEREKSKSIQSLVINVSQLPAPCSNKLSSSNDQSVGVSPRNLVLSTTTYPTDKTVFVSPSRPSSAYNSQANGSPLNLNNFSSPPFPNDYNPIGQIKSISSSSPEFSKLQPVGQIVLQQYSSGPKAVQQCPQILSSISEDQRVINTTPQGPQITEVYSAIESKPIFQNIQLNSCDFNSKSQTSPKNVSADRLLAAAVSNKNSNSPSKLVMQNSISFDENGPTVTSVGSPNAGKNSNQLVSSTIEEERTSPISNIGPHEMNSPPVPVEKKQPKQNGRKETKAPDSQISEPTAVKRLKTNNKSDLQIACKFCGKMFSENVISLHQNLHFRVKFFSCVSCNKNFTTEIGLDKHRCEGGT